MAVKPEKIIPKFQQICAKESEFAMTGGLLKKPRGAPPRLFEPDMGEAVLKYIGEGYSLNQALQKVPGAPCWSTFWDWIYDAEKCPVSPQHAAFGQAISRARKKQAAAFFDQCIEIANDKSNDLIKRVDKHGNEQDTPNPVAVARAKLQIDTRLRLAELIDPTLYAVSKRLDVTSNGESINGKPSANSLEDAKARIMQALTGEDRVKAVIDLARAQDAADEKA